MYVDSHFPNIVLPLQMMFTKCGLNWRIISTAQFFVRLVVQKAIF